MNSGILRIDIIRDGVSICEQRSQNTVMWLLTNEGSDIAFTILQ